MEQFSMSKDKSKTQALVECLSNKILVTPFNWNLVLGALLLEFVVIFVQYSSNGGFDLPVSVLNFIAIFSAALAVVGVAKKELRFLGQKALLNFVAAILALVLLKSLLLPSLGALLLCPLTFFGFLVLVKNCWIELAKK